MICHIHAANIIDDPNRAILAQIFVSVVTQQKKYLVEDMRYEIQDIRYSTNEPYSVKQIIYWYK